MRSWQGCECITLLQESEELRPKIQSIMLPYMSLRELTKVTLCKLPAPVTPHK